MSAIPGEAIFELQHGTNLVRLKASSEGGGRVKIETPAGVRVVGVLLGAVLHTMCRPVESPGKPKIENGMIVCLGCAKYCQFNTIFMDAVSRVTAKQRIKWYEEVCI